MSVSEKDFELVADCTIHYEARGDIDRDVKLDHLARYKRSTNGF